MTRSRCRGIFGRTFVRSAAAKFKLPSRRPRARQTSRSEIIQQGARSSSYLPPFMPLHPRWLGPGLAGAWARLTAAGLGLRVSSEPASRYFLLIPKVRAQVAQRHCLDFTSLYQLYSLLTKSRMSVSPRRLPFEALRIGWILWLYQYCCLQYRLCVYKQRGYSNSLG